MDLRRKIILLHKRAAALQRPLVDIGRHGAFDFAALQQIYRQKAVVATYIRKIGIPADKVGNGVFWLKTEQESWALSVACPVYDDINLDVQKRSVTMQVGLTKWSGNTCPYQFYPYCASCLPLLELIEFTNPGWAGKFSMPAIKNAILESFPEYAEWYNQNTSSQKEEIIYTADVGTVFYRFPD